MYRILKRIIDLLIATLVLVISLPVFLPIMILLKLSGEHEIWYFQERIGFKNKPFDIWKFATMLKDSPNMLTGDVTLKNDPRVLPMGKFLRKTKLNELPQVINVLKGDMSLVGARPLVDKSFFMYEPEVQKVIYNTPPGITGIGSVIFRDEESMIDQSGMDPREFYETNILPYKGRLELWYQEHKSVWVDFLILFLTAWVVIFPASKLPYKVFRTLPERNF